MLSRIIGEIFTYSQETKTLIAVRKSNNDDDCWIGYIVDFNDTLFVLQHISPLGLEDGLIIERTDNIDNFETEDAYIKSIQKLFEQKNIISRQIVRNIEISNDENWQYEILRSEFYHGKLITVEVNNSDAINFGFVLDYDDTSLQLTSIDKMGEEDGTQLFRLADITSLTVDRIEGRKREGLYGLRKKVKNPRKEK
ncbi:MAG: hypothetical protein ABIO79_01020 [Ferruginibacter sp.]